MGLILMTSKFVVLVVGNVFIAATLVEVLRSIICVDFDFLFGDELTQKLESVLAVNCAVAFTRLPYVAFVIWTQLGTHFSRCTGLAAVL